MHCCLPKAGWYDARMLRPNTPSSALVSLLVLAFPLIANATDAAPAPAPAAAVASAPAAPAGELTADKVVEGYLKALQEHRFADAYEFVSTTMRAGKSKEEGAKEQQYIVQMGEVKIFEFRTFPAIIGADGRAKVPNILKSQDKFLNQLGLDEHEVYELLKEDGKWRIDQQTLVEGADRAEYFPGDSAKP